MARDENSLMSRRAALCGGGANVVAAMIATLLAGARPLRAATVSGPVPEIDALAVRVVIDSYKVAVASGGTNDGLDVQQFGWGIGKDSPPRRTLVSEFGLAMHVESRRGGQTRNVLVDFGFTPEALINNVELL